MSSTTTTLGEQPSPWMVAAAGWVASSLCHRRPATLPTVVTVNEEGNWLQLPPQLTDTGQMLLPLMSTRK